MSGEQWEHYVEAVREAYRFAKGEVAAKQRGRRVRLFDERGVHPFSQAWGRASALRCSPAGAQLTPEQAAQELKTGRGWQELTALLWDRDGDVSSLDVLAAARTDARDEFIALAKEGKLDEDEAGRTAVPPAVH